MIKHFKLFFACMLMAVLSIGQMWATDEVVYTLTPVAGSDNGYATNEDIDITDGETTITWNVTGNATMTPWRIGGKNLSGVNREVYSKDAMSAAITKVELTVGTASSVTVNSLKLIVASDEDFSDVIDEVTEDFTASSTITFEPTSPATKWATGAYYKFVFNVTIGGNNKYVQFTEAKFYAEAAAPAYTITAQSNDESKGTVSLTGSVITGSPKSGCRYASPAYTVTSGTATVAQSGNAFSVTPSSDCTVRINFEAVPQYTVTWNNNGATSTSQVYDGEKPVFPTPDPTSCDGTSTTFIGWATAAWTGKAANLTGKTVYTSADAMPAVSADIEYFAVFAKGTSAPEVDHDGPSFSRSGTTDTYTSGYTFTAQAENKSGYYQDGSGTDRYVQVLNTSTPIFSATPSSITVTAVIGGGTGNTDLANPVYAQLLDKTGATIGTAAVVTEHITTNTGDTYSNISLSTTGITSAYGLRISHVKETGYNVRYYSFSLSYTTGGTTYSDYMTTCTAAGTVATPTFSVIAGTYNVAKSVELECETEGATIYYTTNGNAPTSSSTEYTGAISVDKSMTIKAIAIKDGLTDSEVAEATYTLQCIAPTITKTPKHFLETANVTITCADGETIHYTTNGSDPTTSSATYTAPFEISATTTVKAIAVKTNWNNSDIASETYTKAETPLTVAQARSVIDGGTGLTGRYVVGQIYQIDSYDGTHKSLTYWISDDGTSSNPLEVYSGKGIDGADFSAITDLSVGDIVTVYGELKKYNSTYEFNYNNEIAKIVKDVATPTFSPLGSGFLSNTLEVSLTTTEEGGEIRYTTDGSEPTSTSTLYENPIEISATTTFKAATFKGGNASAVVEKKYVKGTKINVAAALEALDSNDPIADQFVYGIVSTAPTYLNNGKLTYSISDDGSKTNELKVYNGYNLAGANFTDKTDIQEGDLVTVFGELTTYNSEKEFSQGNHLVEFARLDDPELDWSESSAVVGITGDKNYPSIVNPHSVSGITYSSSDPTVASFANENTYEITLHKAGTVTITATYSAGNGYKNDEASYTLEVRDVLAYVTITYDCDGATTGCPDPTVVENQTNLPNPLPTVTKSGFNFGGWFTNSAKTDAAVPGNALTADVTLYAKWIEIPTFNNENYEWQLVSSDAQLIAGKYYVIVHTTSGNTMTKSIDSYATVVASTIEDGVIAYNALGANAAVFQLGGTSAAWTLTEATTGDLLGATTGKNFSWEYNQAWTIEIEDNDASITNTTDGCGVICYNTSANPKRFKPYASSNSGTPLPQLYVWALKTYKLRYDANGGTNAPAVQSADGEGKATVTTAIPTAPTDKIFERWNTQNDGLGTDKAAGDVIDLSTADVTLYAIWRDPVDNITISYDANGGEGSIDADADQVEGTQYTIKANAFTREGYSFAGWKAYDASDNELTITSNKITVPSTNVTIKAQWGEITVTDFVLVTDVNQLKDGDKVYIVSAENNTAMSTKNATKSYYDYVEIQKSADNSHVVLISAEPLELTLGKDGNNFTFYDGTGYLCATSNSSNDMSRQTTLDNEGRWAITITDGAASVVAQGEKTRKYMRYNHNSGQERFSCYAETNTMKAVAIYKRPDYSREVTAGKYGTICLPKAGKIEGAEIYEIAYYGQTSQKIFMDQIPSGEMVAGRPYIFLPTEGASKLGVYYSDNTVADVSAGHNNGLYGSYAKTELPTDGSCYILLNNQYCQVLSADNWVGANKAYIKLGEITPTEPALKPGIKRVGVGVNAPQTPTGVDNLNASETPVKVMINGQMYILRGEKMYNANGQLVK